MLKTRAITAAFLLVGFISVLFYLPSWIASFVFAAVAGLAAWEWAGLLKGNHAPGRIVFALLTFALAEYLTISHAVKYSLPLLCSVSFVFWLCVVPFWFKHRWQLHARAEGYAVGLLVILPTWGALLDLYSRNPWLLLAAMALVWVADCAAYFTGRKFGKNKLAPTISPGKTREGAIGAVIAVLIYGFVIAFSQMTSFGLSRVLGLGVILVALTYFSIIGDLYESLLKREAGIKDSSNLLPGHGGVLDRIDSQTSTLPLVAMYLYGVGL